MANGIYSEFEKYQDAWPDIIVLKEAYKLPGFPYSKLGFRRNVCRYPLSELKNKKDIPNTIKKDDLLSFLFSKKKIFYGQFTNQIKEIVIGGQPMSKNGLISICMKLVPANNAFRSFRGKHDTRKEVKISVGKRELARGRINYLIRKNILYKKDGKIYLND